MSICAKIPKLSKCCGCINLRTGGLIIAGLSIFFGVLGAINATFGIVLLLEKDKAEVEDYNIAITSNIINLVVTVIELLLHLFLFFGIITNRHHWLLPYLWVSAVGLGLMMLSGVIFLFVAWPLGIVFILGTLISVYFWMCIQSLYQEIQENNG